MTNKIYLSSTDIVSLEMRKVIIQPKSTRVVVYFFHPTFPGSVAFSATMSFHAKDDSQWFTSFQLYEGENTSGVSHELSERIESQMKIIFGPYFDSVMKGVRSW